MKFRTTAIAIIFSSLCLYSCSDEVTVNHPRFDSPKEYLEAIAEENIKMVNDAKKALSTMDEDALYGIRKTITAIDSTKRFLATKEANKHNRNFNTEKWLEIGQDWLRNKHRYVQILEPIIDPEYWLNIEGLLSDMLHDYPSMLDIDYEEWQEYLEDAMLASVVNTIPRLDSLQISFSNYESQGCPLCCADCDRCKYNCEISFILDVGFDYGTTITGVAGCTALTGIVGLGPCILGGMGWIFVDLAYSGYSFYSCIDNCKEGHSCTECTSGA